MNECIDRQIEIKIDKYCINIFFQAIIDINEAE